MLLGICLFLFVGNSVQDCDVYSLGYPKNGKRGPDYIWDSKRTPGSLLRFTCDSGFAFPDDTIIKRVTCQKTTNGTIDWNIKKIPDCLPICNGKCQNGGICRDYGWTYLCLCVYGYKGKYCEEKINTDFCTNEYDDKVHGFDIKNAICDPKRSTYRVGDSVKFTCPKNYYLRSPWLVHKTYCRVLNGAAAWTEDWPLCHPIVCKKPSYYDFKGHIGIIRSSFGKLTVGSKIAFQCSDNKYVWGSNIATCIVKGDIGVWTELPKCLTLKSFRYRCDLRGEEVGFEGFKGSEAYCKPQDHKVVMAKKQLKTITVVTSTAAAIFGVLLLVVAVIAFKRRQLLVRIRRLQERDDAETSELSNNIDHDIHIQHLLPSYTEAVQSKPTDQPPSFDEATQQSGAQADSADLSQHQQQSDGGRPLQTLQSVAAVDNNVRVDVDNPSPPPYELEATATTLYSEYQDGGEVAFNYDNGVFVDDLDSMVL